MARATFGGRGDEIFGLILVIGGLLAGLSVYLDKAGVLGRLLDGGLGWSVGATRAVLPVAMLGTGLTMFRERSEFGEISKRLPIGLLMAILSVTGLLHMGRGRPGLDDGVDGLGEAGGLIGLGVGGGLEAAVAPWGASLILIGVGLVSVAVITRTTVRQTARGAARGAAITARYAARGAAGGLRPAIRGVKNWIEGLLTAPGGDQPVVNVPQPQPPVAAPTPAPAPPSEPAADSSATPAKPRRRKARPGSADSGEQLTIELGPALADSRWRLPSLGYLSRSETRDVDAKAVEERGIRLQEALAAHGVETRLVEMTVGPTVTRFALQLGEGVKVARITSLNKDIAYALAAADVRILAPIPGQQAIGIEVPNEDREVVALGDILASPEAAKARHPLEVAIGRDISGRSVMLNLATMPHLLIAGATGAGKSSCINSLITSVLMRSTPEQVRMILIDPKRVEMGQYEGVPHLLTAPVTDPKKAANALHWAVREMERRYDLLSACGFRDISGYNAAFDRGDLKAPLGVVDDEGEPVTHERLSFVLLVVDELADLMMVAARDVEDSICRLAQMARAVGIHLVVATQRPSVNVITGVIKANIPARLAFAVSSLADSRVILDQPGAERLVGKGDMLLLRPSSSVSQRIQGAWADESEVREVVESWVLQVRALEDAAESDEDSHDPTGPVDVIAVGPPADLITGDISRPVVGGESGDDELFEQARQLVVSSQLGSTSMLQRKLRVGFARAGRLMDLMEESGVVGPSTGSKARVVLISSEQLEDLQGQGY
ncbi:MAG: DNA translocase FtsK [Acidimicrobiales bacterium]|nr:DNA translocase FtsK [Acidimicrobiales bacterium]